MSHEGSPFNKQTNSDAWRFVLEADFEGGTSPGESQTRMGGQSREISSFTTGANQSSVRSREEQLHQDQMELFDPGL